MLCELQQAHLMEGWPKPGTDDDKKHAFFKQASTSCGRRSLSQAGFGVAGSERGRLFGSCVVAAAAAGRNLELKF